SGASCFIVRQRSRPWIFGSLRSSTTRAGNTVRKASRPDSPSAAKCRTYPSYLNTYLMGLYNDLSSSIISSFSIETPRSRGVGHHALGNVSLTQPLQTHYSCLTFDTAECDMTFLTR